jgi:hypothetical protein
VLRTRGTKATRNSEVCTKASRNSEVYTMPIRRRFTGCARGHATFYASSSNISTGNSAHAGQRTANRPRNICLPVG